MSDALSFMHWVAGLVVLSEALNKLERTHPCAPGLTPHERVVDSLKALAWWLLALGAGGALASPVFLAMGYESDLHHPLLRIERPTLAETCALLGFAVLIVRTRIKEG